MGLRRAEAKDPKISGFPEVQNAKSEVKMGEVITYMNAGELGMFCQIKLDSEERILISIGKEDKTPESPAGIKICELDFRGLTPIRTIWETTDLTEMIHLFMLDDDKKPVEKTLLDCVKDKLINSKSIKEVKEKLVGKR